MQISWFFYSDTNASASELTTVLNSKEQVLTTIYRLEDLHLALRKTTHAVLFLKTHTVYNVYQLCQEISTKYPHVYIILLVPDNMENMKKAMLVGASNIARQSAEAEELTELVSQASKYMNHRQKQEGSTAFHLPKENSKVISVCSAKGGSGRTSVTVNLATAFAKQNLKVAVIDADLQFGDIAVYLDLKPKQTIYEWIKEAYDSDPSSIEQYMVRHESGVAILAAPLRPEFFEIVTEEHIGTAIDELKKVYDVVLIDTSAYLSEVTLKCLVESQEILMLTTKDLPAVRSSKLLIDALETLQLNEKVKVILNQDNKNKTIDSKRIEEVLQSDIFFTLPEQANIVSLAINEGVPFVLKNTRTPLAKGILALAAQFSAGFENGAQLTIPRKAKRRYLVKK